MRWSSGPATNVVLVIRTALVFVVGVLVGTVVWPALDHSTRHELLSAPFVVLDHLVALVTSGPSGPGHPRP